MLQSLADNLIPGRASRAARKLLAQGEPVDGRIDAIRIVSRADSPDRWEFGVTTADGRLGVRQWLEPQRERAHLGATVVLRRRGDQALIDWPATLRRAGSAAAGTGQSVHGWKALGEPPPPGIDDPRPVARRRPEAVAARLTAASPSSAALGMLAAWDVDLRLGERDVALRAVGVPVYAVHLLVPGTVLPATADGVDWVAAAEAAAGEHGSVGSFDFDGVLGVPEDESDLDIDEFMAEFGQPRKLR